MFQTNEGPSFPAHQYIVSGTSTIANGSSLRASENPSNPPGFNNGGCDAPPGSLVPLIDANGQESQLSYPCFDRISLMQLLDKKSLSWQYYQASQRCRAYGTLPTRFSTCTTAANLHSDVVTPSQQFLKDIAAGKLADVTWVTPDALWSDHAHKNNGSGPSWVADDRQCHWQESLLERYGDLRDLGRLGRMVRSRAASAIQLVRTRFSRAAHRDHLPVCEGALRIAYAARVRQHPEVYRRSLRTSRRCIRPTSAPTIWRIVSTSLKRRSSFSAIPAPHPAAIFSQSSSATNIVPRRRCRRLCGALQFRRARRAGTTDGAADLAICGRTRFTVRNDGVGRHDERAMRGWMRNRLLQTGTTGSEHVLYRFLGGTDGAAPTAGLTRRKRHAVWHDHRRRRWHVQRGMRHGIFVRRCNQARKHDLSLRRRKRRRQARSMDCPRLGTDVLYGTTEFGGHRTSRLSPRMRHGFFR